MTKGLRRCPRMHPPRHRAIDFILAEVADLDVHLHVDMDTTGLLSNSTWVPQCCCFCPRKRAGRLECCRLRREECSEILGFGRLSFFCRCSWLLRTSDEWKEAMGEK